MQGKYTSAPSYGLAWAYRKAVRARVRGLVRWVPPGRARSRLHRTDRRVRGDARRPAEQPDLPARPHLARAPRGHRRGRHGPRRAGSARRAGGRRDPRADPAAVRLPLAATERGGPTPRAALRLQLDGLVHRPRAMQDPHGPAPRLRRADPQRPPGDRYREFVESGVFVQGIRWYQNNGIRPEDRLATTFEAFIDVPWALAVITPSGCSTSSGSSAATRATTTRCSTSSIMTSRRRNAPSPRWGRPT